MDWKTTNTKRRDRFAKLSLKKNKIKINENAKKLNRSSDVIILNESFQPQIRTQFQVESKPKMYSPIVVDDSSEIIVVDVTENTDSDTCHGYRQHNISNSSKNNILIETMENNQRPSIGGWSPAQNILCATPSHQPIPTTPNDEANVSLEQCSMKKIELSHKKVLDDLYGESWRSISTKKLFKKLSKNIDEVSKKLQFNDDDEDKENIRNILDTNKKLYLTESDAKKKKEFHNAEKRCKKKLYTEKVPSTPEMPKPKPPVKHRNAVTTVKKKKIQAMSVTELVSLMKNDLDFYPKTDENFNSNITEHSVTKTRSDDVLIASRKHLDLTSKKDNHFDNLTQNSVTKPKYEDILKAKSKKIDLTSKNDNHFDKLIQNSVTKPKYEDILKAKIKKIDMTSKNDDIFDSLTKTIYNDVLIAKSKNLDLISNGNDINLVTKKFKSIELTRNLDKVSQIKDIGVKTPESAVKRLSFVGSLADNIPNWRCHVEALQYHDSYKTLKESLARRLYVEFNAKVFGDQLDKDLIITWDGKLRSTAGTATNRLIKNANGDKIRTSSIKLSTKVVDAPQRLRDTLIHEMCHTATWLIDGRLKEGHGPLWKKWATRALRVYPELGEISRCHDLEIHYKYTFKCKQCGYCIKRHSKSIDVTKKCCGYCRGTFEVIVNRKKKDGVIISTPARKGATNDFAKFVKDHYATHKDGRTHAQVMKVLGEQYSAKKGKDV